MALSGQTNIGRSSLIFYLSRPVRAFLLRFSLVIMLLIALVALFVHRVDSPFTRSVKMFISDQYVAVAEVATTPLESFYGLGHSVTSYFFVHSRNEMLLDENKLLKRQLAKLSGVNKENEQLKKLVHYVEELPLSYVSTKVVGTSSGPYARSAMINAGKNDGVESGQALVSEDGLVGRVIDSGVRSSKILLLTDINSRIPVISHLSRQRAILAGRNERDPQMLYLPEDTALKEGEEILTSGDGGLFPDQIPVGIVYKDGEEIYNVRPYATWHSLEHLSVLTFPEPVVSRVHDQAEIAHGGGNAVNE